MLCSILYLSIYPYILIFLLITMGDPPDTCRHLTHPVSGVYFLISFLPITPCVCLYLNSVQHSTTCTSSWWCKSVAYTLGGKVLLSHCSPHIPESMTSQRLCKTRTDHMTIDDSPIIFAPHPPISFSNPLSDVPPNLLIFLCMRVPAEGALSCLLTAQELVWKVSTLLNPGVSQIVQ